MGIIQNRAKNIIINGGLDFFQRFGGTAVAATATYCGDRWKHSWNGSGLTAHASQSSSVPSNGKSNWSQRMTIDTAQVSLSPSNYLAAIQYIEGYNIQPLIGHKFSIGFWARSNKTGIYCCSLRDATATYSFVHEFEITSIDVWQYFSFVVDAPPISLGTFNLDSNVGMVFFIVGAAGSTYHAPSTDQWVAGDYFGTSTMNNLADTLNNRLEFTQVMMNSGAAVAPFERAGYNISNELQLCQRYYEKSYNPDQPPGFAGFHPGFASVSTSSFHDVGHNDFKVTKRATPAVTIISPNSGAGNAAYNSGVGDVGKVASGVGLSQYSLNSGNTSGDGNILYWHFTADCDF